MIFCVGYKKMGKNMSFRKQFVVFSSELEWPPGRLDDWEIPREKLHLIRAIGEGAFGVVMEGVLDTGNHTVIGVSGGD